MAATANRYVQRLVPMNACRVLVVAALLMLVLPMTAAGVETTNVTIGVNEYVALNNDIYIEVLDVSGDMGWSAQVHFYSYLDSVGTKKTLYTGDIPSKYTSGSGLIIEVKLDSVFSNAASFVIESSKKLYVTERGTAEEGEEDLDIDDDGVPDIWDLDNSTPAGYWTDSDGRGRMWGDMNGDGKLTSEDALLLLQAVVGKIDL